MSPRRVRLAELDPRDRRALTRRCAVPDPAVRRAAAEIVERVREGGDAVLRDLALEHGGGLANGEVRVSRAEISAALEDLDRELWEALEAAIANVRAVHEPQRPVDHVVEPIPGVRVERRWTPLRRVGVYVPGGRATYPSSLVMGVVPARVAAVPEIAVATPARPDGTVDPVVLAAAALLGVEEVYAVGGAQAVAALAYGTETIPSVDRIVGPGGPWVTAAKLAVYGEVGVDLPAGPSEAVVVVDGDADPRVTAADLLCQAEHGPDSPVVLVATSEELADAVEAAVAELLPTLVRREIVEAAWEGHGLVAVAEDLDAALTFAEDWAPEHLTLHTPDPAAAAEAVPSAGSVFLGRWTPESAGDYATGANHVLPTGGLARSHGPLAVEDFGSWRQVQELTRQGLERLAPTIVALAGAEGLDAHARCVAVRLEGS